MDDRAGRPIRLRRAGGMIALVAATGALVWQAAPATATETDSPAPPPTAHSVSAPADDRPKVLHGDEATDILDRIPPLAAHAVAQQLDRSLGELVDDLERDPTMFITTSGMAGYVEPASPTPPADPPVPSAIAVPDGVDVFALSSRPSSPLTVYLDLNGHLLDGELWNYYYSIPPTPLDAFDRDGDPTSFNAAERAEIYEIWLSVSDDFAPFDVNVTTADPGTEALRRTGPDDAAYGSRLVVTGTNWRGSAGVAFLGVFDYSQDVSAFAFSDQLGNASRIAHAASHEIGHTLGLHHDGYYTSEYYFGTSTWGPIMGGSGGSGIIQWSKGGYPGATEMEDDLDIIGDELSALTDDHGDSGATATALDPWSASEVAGLISDEHDTDVFDVGDTGSSVDLTLRPAIGTSNLHAEVAITEPDGTPVATLTPTQARDWTIQFELPPGRHLVTVRSAPWGTAPHGFTTYGSIGAYTLSLEPDGTPPTTVPPTTTPPTTSPPTTTPPTTSPPTTVPPPTTTPPTTVPPTTSPPSGGAGVSGPAVGAMQTAVRVGGSATGLAIATLANSLTDG